MKDTILDAMKNIKNSSDQTQKDEKKIDNTSITNQKQKIEKKLN